MSSLTPILSRDPDVLIRMVHERDIEIERLQTIVKTMAALVFGARSERAAAILEAQGDLDLGDLATDVTPPPAANDQDPAPAEAAPARAPRKPAQRNIGFLPKHLPRIVEILEPAITECPCCAGKLHKIGEDVAEAMDAIPAILRVLRTIRPVYACRTCQDAPIQAPGRTRLFDGGMATTAMIASIVAWKYAWHLPLYRQTQIFAGQGVHIDRSTLARCVCRAAWWLKPLYDLQLATLHGHPRLFCDETRMPVLEAGRKRCRISQFWTHAVDDRPWNGPAAPAVVYVFAKTRAHRRQIAGQLADYQGILQVDAYGGYSALETDGRQPGPIRLAFYMAHARRKFTDVYKTAKSPIARDMIERFAEVYAIEADIRGTRAEERLAARKERTAPLMAALKTRLEGALAEVSAKSSLAGAIRYGLNHWEGLTLFLEDGRIEIDNNTVERNMCLEGLELWLRERTTADPRPLATSLSMLDGFVSAVVAGPVSMDPRAWICPLLGIDPHAFDHGNTPEFAALCAVIVRHNAHRADEWQITLTRRARVSYAHPGVHLTTRSRPVQSGAITHQDNPQMTRRRTGYFVDTTPRPAIFKRRRRTMGANFIHE